MAHRVYITELHRYTMPVYIINICELVSRVLPYDLACDWTRSPRPNTGKVMGTSSNHVQGSSTPSSQLGDKLRYEPEQGLTSPHNEAVTSYLLGAMSASPDLHDADSDAIVSACKTYYETVRRSFRYRQPDLASQAEAVKSSAQSRSRRKRLLEARQSVLANDEVYLWKCATIDLMSDEEDGIVGGVSGWIVRPPSFRSQELTELCASL
ncbi:hypothetical protein ABVT39_014755 [Epinephelus coioides]